MKRKKLITVSGIDGSGKSVLTKNLVEALPNSRYIHIISFRLINRALNILRRKGQGKSLIKSSIDSHGFFLTNLNLFLLLFDIILFNLFTQFSKADYIICDRYFYDLFVSINYRNKKKSTFKFFQKIVAQPDLAILLLTDIHSAQRRELDGRHSIEFLNEKQTILIKMFHNVKHIKIENMNIEQTFELTIQAIQRI